MRCRCRMECTLLFPRPLIPIPFFTLCPHPLSPLTTPQASRCTVAVGGLSSPRLSVRRWKRVGKRSPFHGYRCGSRQRYTNVRMEKEREIDSMSAVHIICKSAKQTCRSLSPVCYFDRLVCAHILKYIVRHFYLVFACIFVPCSCCRPNGG